MTSSRPDEDASKKADFGRKVVRRICPAIVIAPADVAQLVERHLAKVKVAGSIPVIRSMKTPALRRGLCCFRRSCNGERPSRCL
jgi:hypothetical protein